MSHHQKEELRANVALTVFEPDKQKAVPIKELKETLLRLEEQKKELEKKVRAQNQKAQKCSTAAETEKALQIITRALNLYALKKCMKKKGRLQQKIDKLEASNFGIEIQITLLEERVIAENEPIYDEPPIKERSAVKSIDIGMAMNNDELSDSIREINKNIEYMQLNSSAKLWRRCRHTLKKLF